ncbi:MAG: acetate uptake transporter [Candidatus Methanoplasma sp.]|jgi:succinate-acetate transporter protein|nr:acetate uptake transporter [Candidatus Methanoplasma sp.]
MTDECGASPHTVADPAPLGLLAFGMTTAILSLHNLGAYGLDSAVLSMGLLYGGMAQIVAGIFEFKRGNTFGATAFTSYGFFWLSFVAIEAGAMPGAQADAASMGAYFAVWGVMTLFMFAGTLKGAASLKIVFLSLTALFFVVAAKDLSGASGLAHAAGAIGLFCGAAAMYSGLGAVVNAQMGRAVMPL